MLDCEEPTGMGTHGLTRLPVGSGGWGRDGFAGVFKACLPPSVRPGWCAVSLDLMALFPLSETPRYSAARNQESADFSVETQLISIQALGATCMASVTTASFLAVMQRATDHMYMKECSRVPKKQNNNLIYEH